MIQAAETSFRVLARVKWLYRITYVLKYYTLHNKTIIQ